MDFRRGHSNGDGSWVPATPAKPIPLRPQLILGGMDFCGIDWGGVSWIEPIGSQVGYIQGNRQVSNGGSDQEVNNWGVRNRGFGHINGGFQSQVLSNEIGEWNNLPFGQLLALANAQASGASISGQQEERNSRQSSDFLPSLNTWVQNSQHESSLATMLFQKQSATSLLQNQVNAARSNQRGNNDSLLQVPMSNQSQAIYSNQRSIPNHLPQVSQNTRNAIILDQRGNCSHPQQVPQNGFLDPCLQRFDLNAPGTFADSASDGSISFQPLTPHKRRIEQNNQTSPMLNNLLDESHLQENNMLHDGFNHIGEKTVGLHCRDSQFQSSVPSLPTAPELHLHPTKDSNCAPLPSKENSSPEKQENGVGVNTPQLKPKRKKIRPRVVKEGKAKKTPNSTVKQTTPIETKPAKRKYVRKNGTKTLNKPNASAVNEISDANMTHAFMPSKRTLNFNVEGHQDMTQEGHLGDLPSNFDSMSNRVDFNTISEAQVLQLRNRDSSGNKSTVHQALGLEEDNSRAGFAFDLNCAMTQEVVDYIPVPEKPAPSTPNRMKNGPPREYLNDMSRSDVSKAANRSWFQSGSVQTNDCVISVTSNRSTQLTSGSRDNLSCIYHQPLDKGDPRALKRTHSHSHSHEARSINLIRTPLDSIYNEIYNEIQINEHRRESSYFGSQIRENYKKMRTEESQKTVMTNKSTQVTVRREDIGTESRESSAPQGYKDFNFSKVNTAENLRNKASNFIHEKVSPSLTPIKTYYMPSVSTKYLSHQGIPSGVVNDMPICSHRETIPKKRFTEPTHVDDFASLTAVSDCNNVPTPPKNIALSGSLQQCEIFQKSQSYLAAPQDKRKKVQKYNCVSVTGNSKSSSSTNQKWLQENCAAVYSYLHSSPPPPQISRGHLECGTRNLHVDESDLVQTPERHGPKKQKALLERARRFDFVVDEIIHKLCNLNLNDNALVPYNGAGQILPYEGLFDPIKKRKPRAKVDLDPETERVWMLLMGKEGGNGHEGTDAEKEKWWEEERRIFRGRTDSFIARMHLIQGDRRFTKWNGSVVDSVVGVFLTQNVSDHLSSSAYMSLAAHFPLKSRSNSEGYMYEVQEPDACILDSPGSEVPRSQQLETREMGSNESFASNIEVETPGTCRESSKSSGVLSQDSVDSSIGIAERTTSIGNGRHSDEDERGALEDFISSQTSVTSSIDNTDEVVRSCSDSNSEDLSTGCQPNSFDPTYTTLLQMAGTLMFQEYSGQGNINLLADHHSDILCKQSEAKDYGKRESTLGNMQEKGDSAFIYSSISELQLTQLPISPTSDCSLRVTPDPRALEVENTQVIREYDGVSFRSGAEVTQIKDVDNGSGINGPVTETANKTSCQRRVVYSCDDLQQHPDGSFTSLGNKPLDPKSFSETLIERKDNGEKPAISKIPNPIEETTDYMGSLLFIDQQKPNEKIVAGANMKDHVSSSGKVIVDTTTNSGKSEPKPEKEKKKEFDWDSLRKEAYQKFGKKDRTGKTMDSVDWEAVRCADVSEIAKTIKERGMNNMLAERIKDFLDRLVRQHESIDLEWLRDVPPDKAKEYLLSIRGLGLKSVECVRLLTLEQLAFPVDTNVGRIAVRLGWVPLQPLPESLQLHLLELYPIQESIQKYLWPRLCTLDQPTLYELHYQLITFGKVFCTKSKPNCNACPMRAECKHFASAFASARLTLPGPEEKGIVEKTIPITSDQNPSVHQNASARTNPMELPPPITNVHEILSDVSAQPIISIAPAPAPASASSSPTPNMFSASRSDNIEPIIEVPASPEPECTEIVETDMEDFFYDDDPDEIPTIELNVEDFATNLQSYMQQNNMELQGNDISQALVALTPEATSIPTPKLKNVSRLRTEHQVYELPDSHPLLIGVEKRVDHEVCSYLLAIWTPGETAESTQPPKRCCSSQTSGNLCDEKTCFSCNSIREANSQTVRGTLLIPCRTAMRGSFPLNGTYFQVNEVFADHDSSLHPIDVPRKLLWNLPRRTVLFGTSVPSIFKAQTTQEIQSCFWRGYVCVRGFDQKTRSPKPLMARLHFPASRLLALQRQKEEQQKQKEMQQKQEMKK